LNSKPKTRTYAALRFLCCSVAPDVPGFALFGLDSTDRQQHGDVLLFYFEPLADSDGTPRILLGNPAHSFRHV
jgi:hypothetical protein